MLLIKKIKKITITSQLFIKNGNIAEKEPLDKFMMEYEILYILFRYSFDDEITSIDVNVTSGNSNAMQLEAYIIAKTAGNQGICSST
ncbi:hypothetical protein PGB90_005677 [Kerria lacca]